MNSIYFKIALSLAIIFALLFNMDIEILKESYYLVDFSHVANAIFFVFIQLFLLSLRWLYLINIGRQRMNYSESLEVTVASLLANLVFFTSISGMVVKVAVSIQYGASVFKSIFATAFDRIMTLSALLFFAAVFLPSLGSITNLEVHTNISFLISFIGLALLIFMPFFFIFCLKKIPGSIVSKANVRSGVRYLQLLLTNHLLLAKTLVISFLAQFSFFVSVYFICLGSGVELSFIELMIVLPAMTIIASLPLGLGGWGIREGAFIFGLGLLNVPFETAFFISIQVGLVGLIVTVLAGIPFLVFGNNFYKNHFLKTAKS